MARHATRNPLLLPELFHYVLDYIDEPNPVKIGREHHIRVHKPSRAAQKALFALAQTCHAISEPSLDRLWRALDSLVPLIRCFTQVADVDRTKTPPTPAEWAIIRRYAVRVRELRTTLTSESILSFKYFAECTSSQPLSSWLLPNLRVFVWDCLIAGEQFLAPGLVSLNISFDGELDQQRRLFERCALLCPNLKALTLDFSPWNVDFSVKEQALDAMDALSGSVLRLREVENLQFFSPFDPNTLKHVILSPDYKVLGIMLDPPFGMGQIDIAPADMPFPNVEAIELEIRDFDFLTSLLRPHQQMFRTFELRLLSKGPPLLVQSISSCFTALATPQRMGSVQAININCRGHGSTDVPMSHCTYEILSPLASFRCLRELRIALKNQISIDDDELASLARSWPSLEVLHLLCSGSPKYVTLRGLLALIAGCPELSELILPIDVRIVPMDASPDIRNTAIKCISVPDSLISDPRPVADFFAKHLPCLRDVRMWGWAEEGEELVWMEVNKLLWSRFAEM